MKKIINFQSHTIFHPILPHCDDAEAFHEIVEAKKVLENDFKLNINAISYPNGDYSKRDINICRENGYELAVTVDYGYNSIASDRYRLKRISVNDTSDINELIIKSSGVWAFFKTLNGIKQEHGYFNRNGFLPLKKS